MRNTFGERLRRLRYAAEMTQLNVAQRVGVARSTYALWETDARRPDVESLTRLAALFQIRVDFLLTGQVASAPEIPPELRIFARATSELSPEELEELLAIARMKLARAQRRKEVRRS